MFSRFTIFRRTWLQFSLRGLLLAMLVVGIGLTIYRWPWQEELLETPNQTGLLNSDLGFADSEIEIDGLGHDRMDWEPVSELGRWRFRWSYPKGFLPRIIPPFPERPADIRRLATYRRGWTGRPMKDGREEFRRPDGTLMAVRLWLQGEPRTAEWIQPDGEVIRRESYQNGQAHGPFFTREDTRRLAGVYRAGKKTGVWKHEYLAYGELISVDQTYDAGLPHGDWTWRTAQGQVLQTATFDQGQLTAWNSRPWREALAAWLARNEIDLATRTVFESALQRVSLSEQSLYNRESFVRIETTAGDQPTDVLLQIPMNHFEHGFSFYNLKELNGESNESLLAEMLELALLRSRTLVYRFGVIGVVPICDREVNWRDATGVTRIRFAVGSEQHTAWNEALPNTVPEGIDTDWWFQQLFHGVPIQIDGRELNPGPDAGNCFTLKSDPATGESKTVPCDLSLPCLETSHRRARRDILGLLLLSRGFSCEQRGNVLILHE